MNATFDGLLAGIGFAVLMFIFGAAFGQDGQVALDTPARLGILAASLIASLLGLWLLARSTRGLPVEVDSEVEPPNQVPLEVS